MNIAQEAFSYVGTIPAPVTAPWTVHGTHAGAHLLGPTPTLQITDAGIIRGGGPLSPFCRIIKPTVQAAAFTLTASEGDIVSAKAVSFLVDHALAEALQSGDTLHIARSSRGGLAVSIIRSGRLVAAVGAVSAVDLDSVTFRTCDDLTEATLHRLRRDLIPEGQSRPDPDFPEAVYPVEFVAVSGARVGPIFDGRLTLEEYAIDVIYTAFADGDECVSITRSGLVGRVAGALSAQLLAADGALQMIG